ncbi:unnamed protein product, partial [Polarella glacialis]
RPWTAASDSAPTDAAGPGLSGTATLRDLRRSGQLGTLSEAAQSMLLTGPLFAYGDAEAEPMSPHQATPGFRCGSAESDRQRLSWAGTSATFLSESGASETLQGVERVPGLADLLQSVLARGVGSPSGIGSAGRMPSSDQDQPEEAGPLLPWSINGRSSDAWREVPALQSHSSFDPPPEEVIEVEEDVVVEEEADDEEDEVVVSRTASSINSTVMADSLEEGTFDGGLSRELSRLMAGNSMDESLARSMRRIIQLGTVLTGQRLSEDEIQALPKVRFQDAEHQRCSVCLEAYKLGELLTALSCKHFFHIDCLSRWLEQSAQCPLCRRECVQPSPC